MPNERQHTHSVNVVFSFMWARVRDSSAALAHEQKPAYNKTTYKRKHTHTQPIISDVI